ncbi:MAG: riboflavin synthase subunit alpha [Acinetobacter sp.]|nr:riboflavin synthase subunit alpha [Acinetobacter sp.]
MFTGIVQGMGEIIALRQQDNFLSYTLRLPEALATHLHIGASVANNGCCLTITHIDGREICFDVMGETLAKTNLNQIQVGDWVNVERATRFGDEIGGHVMSGHIMARTHITRIEQSTHNKTLWFALPEQLKPYVLSKGFIGLDGCSLTIGDVHDDEFNVHLIPETLQKTLFGTRQVGDVINVEIDAQTQAIVDTVQRVLASRFAQ